MHVAVTEKSIQKANALFWEQMLAMRLEPVTQAHRDPAQDQPHTRCIGADHVVGSCDLSGAWSGRIEVRLSRGLAIHATSAMLMQPVESVELNDMLDATREIANMIAGTIKSALPRPCSMTVPSSEIEPGNFCISPRTPDSISVFFHHTSGELMIRVWETTSNSATELKSTTSVPSKM
jgi:CheY-specific phosphatase CheX